jgi:hypothetical protein
MNKFISTILAVSILIITNSCRSQDEDLVPNQTENTEPSIIKRSTDSIQVNTSNPENQLVEGDPPPKTDINGENKN